MESLADVLSGAGDDASASSESAPAASEKPAAATDVKPEQPAKQEPAAAPSAAKTTEPKTEQPKAEDAKADTAEVDRARNEKGQFAKADEVASLRTALQEERRKRQDLERKQRDQEAAPKQELPKKDFWDDPDAALEERLTPLEQKLRNEYESRLFGIYEENARDKHTDYDEIVDELLTEARDDAALGSQVFTQAKAARNPAEFLYTYAKNRRELKAVGGDLGKYKETVAAEYTPKITALETENSTLKAEIKQLKAQLDNIGKVPSSLNAEPSATRATAEAEAAEDESLGDIFKPRKRRA